MSKPIIHIGCSSYYTRQWKGIFYPEDIPGKQWFDYYASQFTTYELNGTFYKFPTLKSLENWYNKVPEGYLFSVKTSKLITHVKRFTDCEKEINDFYTACREGLKDKLACILFQLPPSFSYTEDRLQLILHSLNPEFKNVVEFRHESWWLENVYAELTKNDITFCSVNYPKLPTDIVTTNSIAYYRFHGSPKLFYSQYTSAQLKEVYDAILKNTGLKEAYLYFNNTASEAGIVNALEMKAMHS